MTQKQIDLNKNNISVVIPAYNVGKQIKFVVDSIPSYINSIIIVDDASTDETASRVNNLKNKNEKIILIKHKRNQGVGGAILSGFNEAAKTGASIIIKIDGDGQMSNYDLKPLIAPLILGEAEYTKGNRFFDLQALKSMPFSRKIGNISLGF